MEDLGVALGEQSGITSGIHEYVYEMSKRIDPTRVEIFTVTVMSMRLEFREPWRSCDQSNDGHFDINAH